MFDALAGATGMVLSGTLHLTLVGLLCSALLLFAARKYPPVTSPVVEQILEQLPQTQCAQCGYPGCRPYAEAIEAGDDINKCPPGGTQTIAVLADLLGRPAPQLDTSGGDGQARIAVIREADCIGCTLCMPACPVDAIIGAPQMLHSVIDDDCTGCELCIAPCPVDCIELKVVPALNPNTQDSTNAEPCIHCGDCMPACPRNLAPQQLFLHRDSLADLDILNLEDCIECGRCDRVCPSSIALTSTFKHAKSDLNERQRQIAHASEVRMRVERHEQRQQEQHSTTRIQSRPPDPVDLIASLRSRT
jgi:Na+-translocating ferredoxin:NAD+ oxidoreductase subunit B